MSDSGDRVPFGKVARHIWRDQKFRELSDPARLVFLYFLTAPGMNGIGLMLAPVEALRGDLPGMSERRIVAALRELEGAGMVRRDARSGWVWLPKYLLYNRPANPNQVRSWSRFANFLTQIDIVKDAIRTALEYLKQPGSSGAEARSASLAEAFCEVFGPFMAKVAGNGSAKRLGGTVPETVPGNKREERRTDQDPGWDPSDPLREGALPAGAGERPKPPPPPVVPAVPATAPREARGLVPGIGWIARRACLNVPESLHLELLSRNVAGVDEAVIVAFYEETEAAIGEGPVRGSSWTFWRRRFWTRFQKARGRVSRSASRGEGSSFAARRAAREARFGVRTWVCHHEPASERCGIDPHCFLKTLRQVRTGIERLEDVPEPRRSEVADALEAERRTAGGA